MSKEEIAYYMAHINVNGRLVHPSGLSLKCWIKSLESREHIDCVKDGVNHTRKTTN
jgi:hypothetical protein